MSEPVPVTANVEIPYTNQDPVKEDQLQEESELTGTVSKQEADSLKDDLGGGEILDDSEGYTRGKKADYYKQEKEVDAAVDVALEDNIGKSENIGQSEAAIAN